MVKREITFMLHSRKFRETKIGLTLPEVSFLDLINSLLAFRAFSRDVSDCDSIFELK